MSFLRILLVDIILDILYFPLWWYSKGLVLAVRWMMREVHDAENFMGLGIWIKNIFRPMFGQYDFGSRIISFFMRFFQIILRSVILLCFTVFYFALFVVYLILPVVVFYGAVFHFPGIFVK